VAEYLHDVPGLRARTLFATHYHELADLARVRPRVRNAHFEVREWGDEVVFLRRLAPGAASRSYGIQVARLAGLPAGLIERARAILANLEGGELDAEGRPRLAGPAADAGDAPASKAPQLALFGAPAPSGAGAPSRARGAEARVAEELRRVDPLRTTPLDALALLARLVDRLREGDA
jgi:DNA mismatch repair protein MutS